MIVKVMAAQLLWKGDKAALYNVTVQAENGKAYIVKTWSKAIGEGIGKEFDVVSEKKPAKNGSGDESFIKQVGAKGGGNGFYKKQDNSVGICLQCAATIQAAQIRQGGKFDPGALLNMADSLLSWMKAKE